MAQQGPHRKKLLAAHTRSVLADSLEKDKPCCYAASWVIDRQTRKMEVGARDGLQTDAIHQDNGVVVVERDTASVEDSVRVGLGEIHVVGGAGVDAGEAIVGEPESSVAETLY